MANFNFPNQKSIKIFIYVLLTWSISFVSILIFYKYDEYIDCYAEKLENELLILVENKQISKISKNLLIDNKEFNCIITKISREPININNTKYYEVYYKCDLDNKILENNYIFNIKIKTKNTTLLKRLQNNLMEGLKQWKN